MSERRIQALQDQNEALKQANDLLEQQFKLTDKDAVRTEDIKKLQEISWKNMAVNIQVKYWKKPV